MSTAPTQYVLALSQLTRRVGPSILTNPDLGVMHWHIFLAELSALSPEEVVRMAGATSRPKIHSRLSTADCAARANQLRDWVLRISSETGATIVGPDIYAAAVALVHDRALA